MIRTFHTGICDTHIVFYSHYLLHVIIFLVKYKMVYDISEQIFQFLPK